MFIDGDTFRVPPAVASLAPLITGSPKIPAKKLQPYLVSESTPPLLKPWEAGWALSGCLMDNAHGQVGAEREQAEALLTALLDKGLLYPVRDGIDYS